MSLKVLVSKNKYALRELRERVSSLTIVVIAILLGSIVIVFTTLFLVYQFIGPKSTTQDWALDFVQVSEEFNPGQAVTIKGDTVTVYVPPFAIPLPGSILIITRDRDLYPIANHPEWSRPQVIDVQFRNAEGTPVPEIVLSAPIRICFKLTQTQWQDFASRPGMIAIQYYELKKKASTWLNLPMEKHPDLLQLCAWTDHLSLFALAIKADVGIPITGATATSSPTATPTRPSAIGLIAGTDEAGRKLDPQQTSTPVPTNTPRSLATNTSWSTPVPTNALLLTATRPPTRTPTNAPLPTATRPSTRTPTNAPQSTATRRPTATPTRTPRPTSTSLPTATLRPPSATPLPTATPRPPSATPLPTATPRLPTATVAAPTATNPAPTAAIPVPTATAPAPTATSVPATTTDVPPTNPPPTDPPPTNPPPTDPPPPTNPPPTDPPPPTNPPPTDPPPPTNPPPTDPPPTDPPPPTNPPVDTPIP